MPKLTKTDLEKLANELTDETSSVSFFTQDELDAIVQARLGKEKPKLDSAHGRIAQLEAELAEQQNKLNKTLESMSTEGKSELEKLQAELQKVSTAQKAALEEIAKRDQLIAETQTKRQNDWYETKLQTMLLEAGADPNQIADITLVAKNRLSNTLQVNQENGSYKLVGVLPITLQEVDANQVIQTWLDERPNFKRARSPGGGANPAGPNISNPQTVDPFEGLTRKQAIAKALRMQLEQKRLSEGTQGKVRDGDSYVYRGGKT